MSKYQLLKEKVRQEAIEWQNSFSQTNWTMQDIWYYTNRFEKLAKRYGLVKEFKENAII